MYTKHILFDCPLLFSSDNLLCCLNYFNPDIHIFNLRSRLVMFTFFFTSNADFLIYIVCFLFILLDYFHLLWNNLPT